MDDTAPQNPEVRQAPRAPITVKVFLEFDQSGIRIPERTSNLSEGGMFVLMHPPKPLSTVVNFSFKLSDGAKPIEGRGEVVWIRIDDQGKGRPAGIGIRFDGLNPEDRAAVATAVNDYIQHGRLPKVSETDTDISPPKTESVVPPEELADAAMKPDGKKRAAKFSVPVIAGIVLIAAGIPAFFFQNEIRSLIRPTPSPTPTPTPTPEPTPTPSPTASPTPTPEPTTVPALSGVDKLTWKKTKKGLAVTVWGNGPFTAGSYSKSRAAKGSPKEIVRITGVRRVSAKQFNVRSAEIRKIRAGIHRSRGKKEELHLVFDLASPKARITKIEPSGSKLLIYFSK